MKQVIIVCLIMIFMNFTYQLSADERQPLNQSKRLKLKIKFNGETLKGMYNYIDARTESEKKADTEKKSLSGTGILFLSGHGQRPGNAFKFANDLALNSKSGIVVVPVCDTPYGKDKNWHGDRGKDVVLMAMTRHILADNGIKLNKYIPLSEMPIKIDKQEIKVREESLATNLSVVGWSHGGLLSRRFSSAYPDSVVGLGQVCPAGYKNYRFGTLSLITNFLGEVLHIGTMLFTKKAPDVLRGGFGLAQGIGGDSVRGIGSAVISLKPLKAFRAIKDIRDCSIHGVEENLPVKNLENVVVVFAKKDWCIEPDHTGVTSVSAPDEKEVNRFWQTYFPSLLKENKNLTLKFLEGNHMAPIAHHELYAATILENLGEKIQKAPGIAQNKN